MKKIRESVFETNSSSTHSVAIKSKGKKDIESYNLMIHDSIIKLSHCIEEDGYLHIELEDFGWGPDSYNDPYMKLSYLLCMLACTHGILGSYWNDKKDEEICSEMERTDEWNYIENTIIDAFKKENIKCEGIYIDSFDGYIDHQSYEDYASVHDFLSSNNTDAKNFIFDASVILIIDNDNH